MPVVEGAVAARIEGQDAARLAVGFVEQDELDALGVARVEAEADAAVDRDFDTGYGPEAVRSYETFTRLRSEGAIPEGIRFQVCLPTPMAIGYWFVSPPARPDFFAAYERALTAAVAEICERVPPDELALQWDVCQEVLVWEDYFPSRPASYREDVLAELGRLGDAVPEPAELGYHLCYGTPNDEHLVMPEDLGVAVEMANGVLARLSRPVQFLHVPVPRARDDAAYFAPLAALRLPPGCELHLGLLHPGDGDGDRRRIAAARAVVPEFGVATECGWGRADPGRVPGLLESHRRAVEAG